MHEPQFVISGQKRREIKKELHQKKRLLKMNRFINDVHEVNGSGLDEEELKIYEDRLSKEITELQNLLNKRII